ncbi:hypothetical protein M408DRAFT_327839, partial [Serendipita vermifera MAFF 305830]
VHHVLLASEHGSVYSLQRNSVPLVTSVQPANKRWFSIVYEMQNEFERVGRDVDWQNGVARIVRGHVAQQDVQRQALRE